MLIYNFRIEFSIWMVISIRIDITGRSSTCISLNEVFGDIMVLASPRLRLPVDPDDVNSLTRKIFNGSLLNYI